MHDEFASQGLVVVAVSDEGDKLVSDYIDSLGIQIAVGAGSPASGKYGVNGIPHSVLIDVNGRIAWSGSPYELSKGKVKEALKGAKKRSSNFMAVPLEEDFSGRLTALAKTMSGGNPGKSLAALQAIAADEKATADEKTGAATLISSIEEHAQLLNGQAEGFLKSYDVQKGLLVLDALAKEFSGTIGDAAKARAAEVDEGTRRCRGAHARSRAGLEDRCLEGQGQVPRGRRQAQGHARGRARGHDDARQQEGLTSRRESEQHPGRATASVAARIVQGLVAQRAESVSW